MERAVIVAREDVIADVAPFLAPSGADGGRRSDPAVPRGEGAGVEEFERAYVAGVLGLHGGKLSAAARHADMDNKNLWEKMVRYGLRSRAIAGEPPPESLPESRLTLGSGTTRFAVPVP